MWRAFDTALFTLKTETCRHLARPTPAHEPPPAVRPVFESFDTTIGVADLREGCRKFGVIPVGEPILSIHRRSIGAKAVGRDGAESWVKVTALVGSPVNWLRDGDRSQLSGVRKPEILGTCDWSARDRHWLALQMALAPSPRLEPTPWAGPRALCVTDGWIAALRETLSAIGRIETKRQLSRQSDIAGMIARWFGPEAPSVVEEWWTAHGDLQWSNLTAPELAILDWETFRLLPRGYDAGLLIAYSCWYPRLVTRLERAFAADLETAPGRAARLFAIAQLLDGVERGSFSAAYRDPLQRMADRVIRG